MHHLKKTSLVLGFCLLVSGCQTFSKKEEAKPDADPALEDVLKPVDPTPTASEAKKAGEAAAKTKPTT